MATINLFEPNRYSVFTISLAQFYGAQTDTNFEVIKRDGALAESSIGTNFTYGSNGFFRSGTINEIYLFTGGGKLSFSATGLSLDVATRNAATAVGQDSSAYFRAILSGDDTIVGSNGDDLIFGSKGSDAIDGRNGSDVLYYSGFDSNVIVDLAAGTAETGFGTSTVTRVEDVIGSAGDDILRGNGRDNLLQGQAGDDTIDGRSGFDTASFLDAAAAVTVDLALGTATGGSGNDTLASIEQVIGSRFDDTLLGSSRAESFVGSFGDDTINGRGGSDTVSYASVGRGVRVNLGQGTAQGGGGEDSLTSIENAIGSVFADTLAGSRQNNVLRGGDGADAISGGGGNDRLFGDAGNDLLIGGAGNDRLTGGTGNDTFRFESPLGSDTVANFDTIADFRPDADTIELENAIFTRFGASIGAIASANFRIIATGGATDANDFIVYNRSNGALYYDANGSTNGLDDATQIATLATGLALTSADFVLI